MKKLSGELELGKRVLFLPACTHATLGYHMASADVLCVPSIVSKSGDQEGRPTVLVEAAACGVPAVASDVGGVRDFINDGVNGLVVPQADPSALARALANLLQQPRALRQMGQAARQKALETTWAAVADCYAAFTFEAIGGPPS